MIVLREFRSDDLKRLKNLLEFENIEPCLPNSNELIYLSFSDENLIGAIKVNNIEDIWILDYIYIIEKWRNKKIGDGILRVIIDKLDKKKIKKLYFPKRNNYLIKRGFKINKDNRLELDIENFFKDACSSCGRYEI